MATVAKPPISKAKGRDSNPVSRILIAVIFTLIIHVFALAFMWVMPSSPGEKEDELVTEMNVIDPSEISPEQIPDKMLGLKAEEIKNVAANMSAERSPDAINYRSSKNLEADVYSDLKSYEQSIKDELAAAKKADEKTLDKPVDYKNEREMYTAPGVEKSYAAAMVSYDLIGRESKVLPVPGYKCRLPGTVVIDIEVDAEGTVISAELNLAETLTENACLQAEALSYAQKTKFFSKPSSPKKQKGKVIYLFMAQ